jgi:hypothetical protein
VSGNRLNGHLGDLRQPFVDESKFASHVHSLRYGLPWLNHAADGCSSRLPGRRTRFGTSQDPCLGYLRFHQGGIPHLARGFLQSEAHGSIGNLRGSPLSVRSADEMARLNSAGRLDSSYAKGAVNDKSKYHTTG